VHGAGGRLIRAVVCTLAVALEFQMPAGFDMACAPRQKLVQHMEAANVALVLQQIAFLKPSHPYASVFAQYRQLPMLLGEVCYSPSAYAPRPSPSARMDWHIVGEWGGEGMGWEGRAKRRVVT